MADFKVICKATKDGWYQYPTPTKVVYKKSFFGLKNTPIIVDDPNKRHGPDKDEICIVYEVYDAHNRTYYKLKGYGEQGYDSVNFIRLDELAETQKEIAEKTQLMPN